MSQGVEAVAMVGGLVVVVVGGMGFGEVRMFCWNWRWRVGGWRLEGICA